MKNGGITLLCPKNPQAAVVQGAALRGLEGIAPRVKRARRHYGFSISKDFREGIDSEDYAFFSEFDENRKMCRNRIWWLISKVCPVVCGSPTIHNSFAANRKRAQGDEITKDTCITAVVCTTYSPGSKLVNRTRLYSCALAEAPEYSTHSRVDCVGSVESSFDADFDFSKSTQCRYNRKENRIVYRYSYEVQVRFGDKGDNLTFKSIANGQEAGSANIKFDQ
jgi:hypothetical protein